jgi:desulfoferrodoxin (superoxide reductase-like protein)
LIIRYTNRKSHGQVNHTLKVHIYFEKLRDQCAAHHIDWICSVQGHWNVSPIQLTDKLNPEIMIEIMSSPQATEIFCWQVNQHTWFKLSICCRFSSCSEFNFCLFHRSQYRLSQACLYMSSMYTFLATTDIKPDNHLGQTEKRWFVNLNKKRKDFT